MEAVKFWIAKEVAAFAVVLGIILLIVIGFGLFYAYAVVCDWRSRRRRMRA